MEIVTAETCILIRSELHLYLKVDLYTDWFSSQCEGEVIKALCSYSPLTKIGSGLNDAILQ